MMPALCLIPVLVLTSVAPSSVAEAPAHPPVYVDEGACPGEGCAYGKWKVETATELHALPDKSSKVDVLWVYTYLGEGTFRVWFAGRFTEQDLNFSPWGGSGGTRCQAGPRCWGELKNELDMEWWVRLQMADGVTGWSLEDE